MADQRNPEMVPTERDRPFDEARSEDRERRQAESRKFWMRRRNFLAFLMLVLLAVLIVFIVAMAPVLTPAPSVDGKPGQVSQLSLTVALVIGAAVLLMMVMILSLVARFVTGRKGRTDALGLPSGSVGAIIALMLLLIFSLLSVFLFSEMRAGEGDGFVSTGVTVDAIKSLPQERILEVTVENPQAEAAARTFQVKLAAAHPASDDFARAAALTVGTLLTTVVGFYFGQRATQTGAQIGATGATDSLSGTLAPGKIGGPGPETAGVNSAAQGRTL